MEIPIFPMKLDAATVQRLFEHAKIPLFLHAAEFFSFFPGFESAIINFFFSKAMQYVLLMATAFQNNAIVKSDT